jgi:hypothetical protein
LFDALHGNARVAAAIGRLGQPLSPRTAERFQSNTSSFEKKGNTRVSYRSATLLV